MTKPSRVFAGIKTFPNKIFLAWMTMWTSVRPATQRILWRTPFPCMPRPRQPFDNPRGNILGARKLSNPSDPRTGQMEERPSTGAQNDEKNVPEQLQTKNMFVSLFKNPIVHQLWTARQEAKERKGQNTGISPIPTPPGQASSRGKTPSESRVQISYPFSTNELLRESYCNPWGKMRFGKMIEDLDALAGNIAFFHVDSSAQSPPSSDAHQQQPQHPLIVTASVDRIRLRRRPNMNADQHLSGQVTWTGTSSMEIRMQCTDSACPDGGEWLEAFVTFVTLDPLTKKPQSIPPVVPQSPEEQAYYQAGAARAAAKKKRRHQSKLVYSEQIDQLASQLLQQAGPLLNMPSLADPHSILMSSTKMQNAMIAQPQVRNLHNRIFGGFLMRRAFELAFSTAYVFGGARPIFLEVDDVSFASPVDVGDLLVFNSRVLYTDQGVVSTYYDLSGERGEDASILQGPVPLVHVEVEAWVTEPEKVTARLSNQFYFTFAMVSSQPVRNVLPSNIDEARRVAMRILTDHEQEQHR